jgi:hypothetical protein
MMTEPQKNKKSVSFGPTVTFIFKDDDVCRECRNGIMWLRYAAVGYEFKSRVFDFGKELEKYLGAEYRRAVYESRFNE